MEAHREHPLYYLDAETLLVATYCWVDDALKALQAQGIKLPKRQKHQKATLAELLTLALFILLQGQDRLGLRAGQGVRPAGGGWVGSFWPRPSWGWPGLGCGPSPAPGAGGLGAGGSPGPRKGPLPAWAPGPFPQQGPLPLRPGGRHRPLGLRLGLGAGVGRGGGSLRHSLGGPLRRPVGTGAGTELLRRGALPW